MASSIDSAYKLLQKRATSDGVSSDIYPSLFNEFWQRAELKFFNIQYLLYAENQKVSDSISKWMSDFIYIYVRADGSYALPSDLLHIDSLYGFLPSTDTGSIGGIGSFQNVLPGTGYTDGSYPGLTVTGGTGTSALLDILVQSGTASITAISQPGTGYTYNDTITVSGIPAGSGFACQVGSVIGNVPYKVKRAEKDRWAPNLASDYDAPNREFPIYTQLSTSLQFAPTDIGPAQMVYLKQPVASLWGYKLRGAISSVTFVPGTGLTNGTYTNVSLTGGLGTGAKATIIVSGGIATSVTITSPGKLYWPTDVLAGVVTGGSVAITVTDVANPRPIYDVGTSVQPKWSDYDISQIVDLCLEDISINARDVELANFAKGQSQTQQ